MTEPRKNTAPTRGKPFAPGNPGRPKGARHKVTLAVEALLEGEAEGLTRKAVDLALAGDVVALRICLDRIAPPAKDRPVNFSLPPIEAATDVPDALAAVMQAVADGDLTPSEAGAMAALVDRWRSAFELTEFERRLAALEERR